MNLSRKKAYQKGISIHYPVMLAEESGEMGPMRAAEILGLDIIEYQELKFETIKWVMEMVERISAPAKLDAR